MLTIIQYTPIWVWFVLAVLLMLGFRQSRTRCLSRVALLPLPIVMPFLAVYGLVDAFGRCAPALGGWLAGFVAALLLLRVLPAMPRVQRCGDGRVQVAGSWWPLVWMLAIFSIRYGMGVAAARAWPVMNHSAWTAASGVILGVLSGLFALRNLRVLRAASRLGLKA